MQNLFNSLAGRIVLVILAFACLFAGLFFALRPRERNQAKRPATDSSFPTPDGDSSSATSDKLPDEGGLSSGDETGSTPRGLQQATFGSGCFWCTEAIFQNLKGVTSVQSGYAGGTVDNPTYEQVCFGTTGHAEVVQVEYDPAVVSYSKLLEVFWRTHDPTTPNRQGNDVGPQYRSVIFFHDEQQRRLAEQYKAKLDAADVFPAPIVTEISPLTKFFAAESDHQDFFDSNPQQPYCYYVIRPKLEKLSKVFRDDVKDARSESE